MIGLILIVFFVATFWRIFAKANQPGWATLIPVYNLIVFMRIIKRPAVMLLLLFIPFVNIYIAISFIHTLSKSFGNDAMFTIGLIFLPFIFYPILAFGNHQYIHEELKNDADSDIKSSDNAPYSKTELK
jgi:hypothetical protein